MTPPSRSALDRAHLIAVALVAVACAASSPAPEPASGSTGSESPAPEPVATAPPPDTAADETPPVATTCVADADCAEGSICDAGTCAAACAEWPDRIQMVFDESAPPASEAAVLDAIALCARTWRGTTLELTGCVANDQVCDRPRRCHHYDEEYAMALGDRMARGVRAALEQRGVATARVQTRSAGIERWVCTDETAECRDRNRRVELTHR